MTEIEFVEEFKDRNVYKELDFWKTRYPDMTLRGQYHFSNEYDKRMYKMFYNISERFYKTLQQQIYKGTDLIYSILTLYPYVYFCNCDNIDFIIKSLYNAKIIQTIKKPKN